jgi:hypothetical protein
MSTDSIKEQIEQRLQSQQASKEFKDVGRVAMTKKELSAYKYINISTLDDLEKDAVMARDRVKKDAVWLPYDVNLERESGVSSGAAYLKVKIRESVPTRPKDNEFSRGVYVLFLGVLQEKFVEFKRVEQFKAFFDSFRGADEETIYSYIIPKYREFDADKKSLVRDKVKSLYRISSMYGVYRLFEDILKEVFGARFLNLMKRYSDAATQIWSEAYSYEPISEEESKGAIQLQKERLEKFIEANEKSKDEYQAMSKAELFSTMNSKWQITSMSKAIYKKDIEQFRAWALGYYDRNIKHQTQRSQEIIEGLKPKGNDWSWFDTKGEKKDGDAPRKQADRVINSKEPLSYIKRTGGYKIEANTPQEIVSQFGFSAVNYGNYVNDEWSKDHTKHFLGAMSDLAEILNIDLKAINQLGKLSIAFGAKGRAGHLATYFSSTKDINLTKKNGDGSVAHEWGHYFDNVLFDLDAKKGTPVFMSDVYANGFNPLYIAFANFMKFVLKGAEGVTPKLPVTFYAKPQDTAPYIHLRSGKINIELKSTIEETLAGIPYIDLIGNDYHSTQERVYGYVISKFGLESYDVPLRLRTSYFYHKSAYSYFKYMDKDEKGRYQISVSTRTKYWTSNVELFARAFETVVLYKLVNQNRMSNYLVDSIPLRDVIAESYQEPYPSGAELEYLSGLLDEIIIAAKRTFSIGDFVPTSRVREDEFYEVKDGVDKKGMKSIVKDDVKEVVFTDGDKVEEVVVTPEKDKNVEFDLSEEIEALKELSQFLDGEEKTALLEEIEGLELLLSMQ